MPSNEAITLGKWLLHLKRQVPLARARDPEGVHQMRVAIAHLRVWLALGGWQILDDDLRWLRQRLAEIRNLDVELQHEPPPCWAATLHQRHNRARRELLATLGSDRLRSLLLALSCLPPLSKARARRKLPRMALAALRCERAAKRHNKRDLASLHRLRCAVRRLRFALEWLAEDASDLVAVQDALGTACDFGVALHELGSRRGKGLRRYRDRLARELHGAESRARSALRRVRPLLKDLTSCSSS